MLPITLTLVIADIEVGIFKCIEAQKKVWKTELKAKKWINTNTQKKFSYREPVKLVKRL